MSKNTEESKYIEVDKNFAPKTSFREAVTKRQPDDVILMLNHKDILGKKFFTDINLSTIQSLKPSVLKVLLEHKNYLGEEFFRQIPLLRHLTNTERDWQGKSQLVVSLEDRIEFINILIDPQTPKQWFDMYAPSIFDHIVEYVVSNVYSRDEQKISESFKAMMQKTAPTKWIYDHDLQKQEEYNNLNQRWSGGYNDNVDKDINIREWMANNSIITLTQALQKYHSDKFTSRRQDQLEQILNRDNNYYDMKKYKADVIQKSFGDILNANDINLTKTWFEYSKNEGRVFSFGSNNLCSILSDPSKIEQLKIFLEYEDYIRKSTVQKFFSLGTGEISNLVEKYVKYDDSWRNKQVFDYDAIIALIGILVSNASTIKINDLFDGVIEAESRGQKFCNALFNFKSQHADIFNRLMEIEHEGKKFYEVLYSRSDTTTDMKKYIIKAIKNPLHKTNFTDPYYNKLWSALNNESISDEWKNDIVAKYQVINDHLRALNTVDSIAMLELIDVFTKNTKELVHLAYQQDLLLEMHKNDIKAFNELMNATDYQGQKLYEALYANKNTSYKIKHLILESFNFNDVPLRRAGVQFHNLCIQNSDIAKVRKWIDDNLVKVHEVFSNPLNNTFKDICRQGKPELVKLLLDYKSVIEEADPLFFYKNDPFNTACKYGQSEIVEILVSKKTKFQDTFFSKILQPVSLKVVEVLLSHKESLGTNFLKEIPFADWLKPGGYAHYVEGQQIVDMHANRTQLVNMLWHDADLSKLICSDSALMEANYGDKKLYQILYPCASEDIKKCIVKSIENQSHTPNFQRNKFNKSDEFVKLWDFLKMAKNNPQVPDGDILNNWNNIQYNRKELYTLLKAENTADNDTLLDMINSYTIDVMGNAHNFHV